MEALVSIIIPVYNLEQYIAKCLLSIVNQTYSNLEILCIDDGSTDSSADVIKSWCENDSRIKYFYKENGGVSSARNLGLDVLNGDFVMFVDGDDYLHPQAVELLYNCFEKLDCDIACADAEKTNAYLTEFSDIENSSCEAIDVTKLYSRGDNRSFANVWSKLYRREVLKDMYFPLGIKYGEDTNFSFKVLSKKPKLAKTDAKVYYYYARENSAETSVFSLNKATVLDSYDDICEYFSAEESSGLKSFALQYLFQTICYIRTLCIGTEYEKDVMQRCKTLGKKWIGSFLKLDNIDLKTKLTVSMFFYSHSLYELVRLILDPTMKEFYKSRKKHKAVSQKD